MPHAFKKPQLKLDPELQIRLDNTPPFTVSIEPVNRPRYDYGYHLGHDEEVAKHFVQKMFRDYDAHHGQGVYTIALLKEGKIHDVYDGRDWSSDIQDRLFSERNVGSVHDKIVADWTIADTFTPDGTPQK